MSSDAMCRIMDAEATGSVLRRMILFGLADNAMPDGRGEAAISDLVRLGECSEEDVIAELKNLRDLEALLWMKHPEEQDCIVFAFRFAHAIYRRAK